MGDRLTSVLCISSDDKSDRQVVYAGSTITTSTLGTRGPIKVQY